MILAGMLTAALVIVQEPQVLQFHKNKEISRDRHPVTLSRDATRALAWRRESGYSLSPLDREGAARNFPAKLAWDDVVTAFLGPQLFSRDGRWAVLPSSGPDADGFRRTGMNLILVGPDRSETLAPARASAWFPCWSPAEDAFFYLDGEGFQDKPGFEIRKHDLASGKSEAIHRNEDEMAILLSVSPSGRRLAFYSVPMDPKNTARLRVLDLKGGPGVETPMFPVDDLIADGVPGVFWDGAETSVYYHRSPDGPRARGRERYILHRFDWKSATSKRVDPERNETQILRAILEQDVLVYVSQSLEDEDRPDLGRLLRVGDSRERVFPPRVFPVAGTKLSAVLLYDGESRTHFTARVEMAD